MLRTAFCALVLFGFTPAALAQYPANNDPTTRGSHESGSTTPHHIPSAGLTLETLRALPPSPDAWFPPKLAKSELARQPAVIYSYQPAFAYYGGWNPYYRFGGPRNFAVYPNGLGGYYPSRGLPVSSFGWWFW
jgi:hypothetical protein